MTGEFKHDPDFVCAICEGLVVRRWNHVGPNWQTPPICRTCETVKGWSWNGRSMLRTPPIGGSHMDKRNVLRIGALADALAETAQRMKWNVKHG